MKVEVSFLRGDDNKHRIYGYEISAHVDYALTEHSISEPSRPVLVRFRYTTSDGPLRIDTVHPDGPAVGWQTAPGEFWAETDQNPIIAEYLDIPNWVPCTIKA